MTDLVIGVIVLVIVAAAVRYLVNAKKRGVKCVGCDSGCDCSQKSNQVEDCGCGRGSACESDLSRKSEK